MGEMSESAPEQTGDTGEVGTQDTSAEDQQAEEQLHQLMQEEDPDELKRQLDHWRKTAQRHERTARDNSAAAAKLRELEQANMTELQKAQAALDAATRERDAARAASTRMMAAAANNLEPDLIDYLGDGTDEEINSRAQELSNIVQKTAEKLAQQMVAGNGTRAPAGVRTGRPITAMRAGAAPTSDAPFSPNEAFRRLLAGEE